MDHNNMVVIKGQDDQEEIDLPPGFRFHPTDEELITHYLCKKMADGSFTAVAIGEADLNQCEPWDLPAKAKMGGNEWYFFYLRDKKYPTGSRTNRATEAGYWKATGKDKEIFKGKSLIGMKKTLVFYRGRAPKGEKSNWVMHEYRLEGILSQQNLPQSAKTEWAICRVFEKSCYGKNVHVPGGVRSMSSFEAFVPQSQLPPLMDLSQSDVSCFSNQTSFPRAQADLISISSYNNDQLFGIFGNLPNPIPRFSQADSNLAHNPENYPFPRSQDRHPMVRNVLDNSCWSRLTTDMNSNEISSIVPQLFENGSDSGSGDGIVELDSLWPN